MLPTVEQRRELVRCFAAVRHAYNWANAKVKERRHFASVNALELRNLYRRCNAAPEWARDVPSRFQTDAAKQLANAYKTNFAKMKKNGNSYAFDVKFRSARRTLHESINIEKTSNGGSLLSFQPCDWTGRKKRARCYALFGSNLKKAGGILLEDSVHVINKMLSDGKLLEDGKIIYDKRTRSFHLSYTHVLPVLKDPDPTFSSKRIVSNDPGIRSFQTFYSPDGTHGELLKDVRVDQKSLSFQDALIHRLRLIDALHARIDKKTNRHKKMVAIKSESDEDCIDLRLRRRRHYCTLRRLKRKLAKERRRHHGFVRHAHYFAANFVLTHYDIVVQPRLATRDLSERASRVLTKDTTRKMLTMSHGMYLDRLKSKAVCYPGRHVIESSEPGTSKTCGHCGCWKANLGGKSIYECDECGIRINRDISGARNNLLAAYGFAVGVGWDGVHG